MKRLEVALRVHLWPPRGWGIGWRFYNSRALERAGIVGPNKPRGSRLGYLHLVFVRLEFYAADE